MTWSEFIGLENIYCGWKDFAKGKRAKQDVIRFEANLEDELWRLHLDLRNGIYHHGPYEQFFVHDPKKRIIHKASVRDRVVHRMLYNYLLPLFNPQWLDCSFSCRPGFGQHVSRRKVERALLQATCNYTKVCIVVKCDVKKFFDNIDHRILFQLLSKKVYDQNVRWLLWQVIDGFYHATVIRGIPLGNLTSQVFANVYLHELDVFAKRILKLRHYYRYADDVFFIVDTRVRADETIAAIADFLTHRLHLELHPRKVIVRKSTWGIDWLGEVLLPGYRVLRPSTRHRMMSKVQRSVRNENDQIQLRGMLASYNGLIQNVAHRELMQQVLQMVALYRSV